MVAGLECVGSFAACQACADGHAVAQRFGQGHHVRNDIAVLMREPLTCPAHAGLNFVQHQQPAMLVANATQLFQVGRIGNIDAAFALDGFDQHGNDVAIQLGDVLDVVDVVVGHAQETCNQRLKACLDFTIAGGAQGGQRTAVEAAFGNDDLRFLDALVVAVQTGNFDRCLVGFRAGIAEENPVHFGQFAEFVCQHFLLWNTVDIGAVHQQMRLFGDGLGNGWVSMAQTAYCDAAERVQILVAVAVPQIAALSPVDGDGKAIVGVHRVISHVPPKTPY